MRALLNIIVLGATIASAAPFSADAVAAEAEAATESAITLVNRTPFPLTFRLRVAGEEDWDLYSYAPNEEADITCDACETDAFEMEIGSPAHRYLLRTGQSFAINFDGRTWAVYEAKPDPVVPAYYANIED